jgi:hypothetical protein
VCRKILLVLVFLLGARARADVGVVLNGSLDTSVVRIPGSGHSAVYFSRIGAASPLKLRRCSTDGQGSVMSNSPGDVAPRDALKAAKVQQEKVQQEDEGAGNL